MKPADQDLHCLTASSAWKYMPVTLPAWLDLTHYLIEAPFDTFANRADPDQAAIIRAAWSGSTLFAYGIWLDMILYL